MMETIGRKYNIVYLYSFFINSSTVEYDWSKMNLFSDYRVKERVYMMLSVNTHFQNTTVEWVDIIPAWIHNWYINYGFLRLLI